MTITNAVLVASGDLRETANRLCWPAQAELERNIEAAFARHGVTVHARPPRGPGHRPRLHLQPAHGHGCVRGHRPGRAHHRGRGGLAVQPSRAARPAATSRADPDRRQLERPVAGPRGHAQRQRVADQDGPRLQLHLERGHDRRRSRTRPSGPGSRRAPSSTTRPTCGTWTSPARCRDAAATGRRLAGELADRMAIMGVFDEGCMGMYNAIIDDEYLNPMGLYKERLSQSALVAEMRLVTTGEARAAYQWLTGRGMQFRLGSDGADRADRGPGPRPAAAVHRGDAHRRPVRLRHHRHPVPAGAQGHGARLGPRRGPAQRRRPATGACTSRRAPSCTPGGRCRVFNEVDEGSAVDGLVTNRVWTALGMDPATTLHDVRWGDP